MHIFDNYWFQRSLKIISKIIGRFQRPNPHIIFTCSDKGKKESQPKKKKKRATQQKFAIVSQHS